MAQDWVQAEFDRRAPNYDDSEMHRALAAAVADVACVREGEHVLDVATGTGLVLRSLASHEDELNLTGVDISANMIDQARRHLLRSHLVRADAMALPFDDDAFDVVTCVAAMPYFIDGVTALHEWHRVLRPGGRVVLATFATDGITGPALLREAAGCRGLVVEDPNAWWGDTKRMAEHAEQVGLRLVTSDEWTWNSGPMSVEQLLEHPYPFAVRDDFASALADERARVVADLKALVERTNRWEMRAWIVTLVAV